MRALPLLLLLSCSTPDPNHGRSPDLVEEYKAAVERRELLRGMHEDEIVEVMGGRPERVSRERRMDRTYTVWEYRSRALDLYLDDGFLVDWRGPN